MLESRKNSAFIHLVTGKFGDLGDVGIKLIEDVFNVLAPLVTGGEVFYPFAEEGIECGLARACFLARQLDGPSIRTEGDVFHNTKVVRTVSVCKPGSR